MLECICDTWYRHRRAVHLVTASHCQQLAAGTPGGTAHPQSLVVCAEAAQNLALWAVYRHPAQNCSPNSRPHLICCGPVAMWAHLLYGLVLLP